MIKDIFEDLKRHESD